MLTKISTKKIIVAFNFLDTHKGFSITISKVDFLSAIFFRGKRMGREAVPPFLLFASFVSFLHSLECGLALLRLLFANRTSGPKKFLLGRR